MAGVLNKIRSNAALVITLIGLSMISFIVGPDVVSLFTGGAQIEPNVIGKVNGERIDSRNFGHRVEQQKYYFSTISEREVPSTAQLSSYLWQTELYRRLVAAQMEKLDLPYHTNEPEFEIERGQNAYPVPNAVLRPFVPDEEIQALVYGSAPDPMVQQYFGGAQGFEQYQMFIQQVQTNQMQLNEQQSKLYLDYFFKFREFKERRFIERFQNWATKGIFVSKAEAKADLEASQTLAEGEALVVNYGVIADSVAATQATEEDYEAYYEEFKARFRVTEPTAYIDYVAINLFPTAQDSAEIRQTLRKLLPEFETVEDDSGFAVDNSRVFDESSALFDYQYKPKSEYKAQEQPFLDSVEVNQVVGPYVDNGRYVLQKLAGRSTLDSLQRVKISHIFIAYGQDTAGAVPKADSLLGLLAEGRPFEELAGTASQDPNSAPQGGKVGWIYPNTFGRKFFHNTQRLAAGQTVVVESDFGAHVVRVDERSSTTYRTAVVAVDIEPSKRTQDSLQNLANQVAMKVNEGQPLKDVARQLKAGNAQSFTVTPKVRFLPGVRGDNAILEVIKWALDEETEPKTLLDPFVQSENAFVVAWLNARTTEDYRGIDDVREEIEAEVLRRVKARMITNQLSGVNSSNLADYKAKAPAGAFTTPINGASLSRNSLPALGNEPKVVGALFGLKPGQVSKPIEGTSGVFVVQLKKLNKPDLDTKMIADHQKQLLQQKRQRYRALVLPGLEDAAHVEDYRYLYDQ